MAKARQKAVKSAAAGSQHHSKMSIAYLTGGEADTVLPCGHPAIIPTRHYLDGPTFETRCHHVKRRKTSSAHIPIPADDSLHRNNSFSAQPFVIGAQTSSQSSMRSLSVHRSDSKEARPILPATLMPSPIQPHPDRLCEESSGRQFQYCHVLLPEGHAQPLPSATVARAARPSYSAEQEFFIMYLHVIEGLSWDEIRDRFNHFFRRYTRVGPACGHDRTKPGLTSKYYRTRKEWGMKEAAETESSDFLSDLYTIGARASSCDNKFLESIKYRDLNWLNLHFQE